MVTVRAELGDGDDYEASIKVLQAKAESLIEDHKRHMLDSIEELEQMTRKQQQAASLERKILDCQRELDRIRESGPMAIAGPQTEGPDGSDDDPLF